MKSNAITVGVIGLGRAGWDIHIRELRSDPRFQIVAVSDPDANRAKETAAELKCETFESFADAPAELIVIASPSFMHSSQAIAAMKAGKHVVVEKPMATRLAEADRMIATARNSRRQLMIHQNYRFFRSCTFIREIIESGRIGRLTQISALAHNYARRNDWQTLAKFGGGVLNNKVIHTLDQCLMLIGAPVVDLFCDMKHISDAGDVEDAVKLVLRAANSVVVDIEDNTSAATTRRAPEWTILGTTGAVTILNGEATIRWYDAKKVKPLKVVPKAQAPGRRYGNDDVLPWQEETVKAEGPDAGSFYDAVFNTLRKRKKFPIDPAGVREMMRLIAECRKQNPKFPGMRKA